MEFRSPKVLRKVVLELFLENYAFKVSHFAYVKGISVKASLLGVKIVNVLLIEYYMLLVKYYGYVEYKD